MKTILHHFQVAAPPARVQDALTTRDGLAGWWSTDVSLEPSGARVEPGSVIHFRFLEVFNPDMRVTSLEPERLVAWRCVGGHEKWRDNDFSFTLRPTDEGTAVTFVQEYARELSDEDYGTYNFNWGYYLGSLKKLCEDGAGTPFEPD